MEREDRDDVGPDASDAEIIEDAIRTAVRTTPELRTELAIERYRSGSVSLNRAAETAGKSPTAFCDLLADRDVLRPAGFLTQIEHEKRCDDLA